METPNSFHSFPKLPLELRLMIWRYAAQLHHRPAVELMRIPARRSRLSRNMYRPIPSLPWNVCQESRNESRLMFQAEHEKRLRRKGIEVGSEADSSYIDPSRDTIILRFLPACCRDWFSPLNVLYVNEYDVLPFFVKDLVLDVLCVGRSFDGNYCPVDAIRYIMTWMSLERLAILQLCDKHKDCKKRYGKFAEEKIPSAPLSDSRRSEIISFLGGTVVKWPKNYHRKHSLRVEIGPSPREVLELGPQAQGDPEKINYASLARLLNP